MPPVSNEPVVAANSPPPMAASSRTASGLGEPEIDQPGSQAGFRV